jgi:hypothetical protein
MISGSRLKIVSSSTSVGVFHGVRVCSGVFLAMRCMTLKRVPGVGAVRRRLYSAAKALGVDHARCLSGKGSYLGEDI